MYMEIILYLLTIVAILITIRNTKIIINYFKNRKYEKITIKFYDDEKLSHQEITDYLKVCSDEKMKHKARIYQMLTTIPNMEYEKILKVIDFKILTTKKNKVNERMVNNNHDIFYWYMVALIKANNNYEILLKLNEKLKENDYLSDYLYFKMTLEFSNFLIDQDINHLNVFKDVIKGNIKNYYHDKRLLFFLKNIAVLILAYAKYTLNAEEINLYENLAQSKLGIYWIETLKITKPQTKKEVKKIPTEDLIIVKKANSYSIKLKNNDFNHLKYQDFINEQTQFKPVLNLEITKDDLIITSDNHLAIESFKQQFSEYLAVD